ncbi:MAG: cytochrome c3 family protein [Desulfobacterales bacterium]|nr:cytochrome c3 family protein [Desulfobacterales bacterium]
MGIKPNIVKYFFIFSLSLVFMISSCSKPSEDKKLPSKQISETTQAEKTIVETSAPEVPKPVTPKPMKQSSLADVITMENPAYAKHKKSIVLFTHKKHVEDYEIGCGKCHHDKNGTPLNDLKPNDKVENCISCHVKLGQAPMPKDKKKLSQKEKLEYHAEAIHGNCIVCHKEHNKKNNTKAAPSSCSKCHLKGE